ncbi:MAG TPA: DoxX family membrane protein, partial [Chthoniobacterales bacterium]|nr:DoxX family membrane protein [Chthoniobacterales bacterium]
MRLFLRLALAIFFLIAGLGHLLMPGPYLAIMPPYIPWPKAMVALSGLAEIFGALGVCLPTTRKAAGWFLIALLVIVFPANIQ